MTARRKPKRARELGATAEWYETELRKQGGGCAICGNPPKTRRLHVDHNHRTGKVRGLLCYRCNRQLGYYVTSGWLRKALAYIERDEDNGDIPDQWRDAR